MKKIKTLLLLTGLISAFGIVGGMDKADASEPPTDRPITISPSLEVVADEYWSVREVTPAPKVEAFLMPSESVVWARGTLGGNKVWLTEEMLSQWDFFSRETICIVYIHERGHNAGLEHDSGWQIMNPLTAYEIVPPKCVRWAKYDWIDWP